MDCCIADRNKRSADATLNKFEGPLTKRSCTDVCFLFIFIVFLCFWGFITQFAMTHGDLDRVLIPTDSAGNKCGVDSIVKDKGFLLFFDLGKCLDAKTPLFGCQTPQVCVEKCPAENFFFEKNHTMSVDELKKKLICQTGVNVDTIRDKYTIEKLIENEKCARWYAQGKPVLKWCTPNLHNISETQKEIIKASGKDRSITSISSLLGKLELFETSRKVVDDVQRIWKDVALEAGLAIIFCSILIAIMRWVATPLVWLSILGVIVILIGGTYFSFRKYVELRNQGPDDINVHTNLSLWFDTLIKNHKFWLGVGIVTAIILVILLLVVLVLRKRIVIAIALVEEGSKAVSSIYSTVFFPIFPWIFQIGVIIFAVYVGLLLSSVGKPINQVLRMSKDTSCKCSGVAANYTDGVKCDPQIFNENCRMEGGIFSYGGSACELAACNFAGYESSTMVSFYQWYNVFGFFWGVFFISALGEMVLAATFATWYWTFNKQDVPFFTLTVGLGRTIRYHLGTIAFGSLLITICRMIRIILEYIDKKAKTWDNEVTKCILRCCKCIFWLLEKFLRFMNKNAYIMCAIHGKPFCSSARDAFNLLFKNFLRAFALDKVTDFLFFLTKILISVGMGSVAYIHFTTSKDMSTLNYLEVPIVIVMLLTYLIASVFFSVYSMAVDTLFLCFLEDSERNDGSEEKPYYMSKQLMKILDKKNVAPREEKDSGLLQHSNKK